MPYRALDLERKKGGWGGGGGELVVGLHQQIVIFTLKHK